MGNTSEHTKRLKDIIRCFMIEKKSIMDEIDDVLSIPGVDMVQFGPSDYSMSSGINLKDNIENAKKVECRMIKAAIDHGVRPRCEIQSIEEAEYYINLGVKDFSIGDQMKLLMRDWIKDGSDIRKAIGNI